MRELGQVSILLLVVFTFLLLCVIAFAGEDFRKRHDWRIWVKEEDSRKFGASVDLGRLFCVWLLRVWMITGTLVIFI